MKRPRTTSSCFEARARTTSKPLSRSYGRAGGCTSKLRGVRWVGRPRSARGYARVLRKLGLAEVGAYLHWPDFRSCRAIVPLDNPVAARHPLARGRRGADARFWMRLAPVLAATHLLAAVVPCASAVGRRALTSSERVR